MLKFIRPTTWEEVFQDWKQREGNDPGWIHCATVLKGWDSWNRGGDVRPSKSVRATLGADEPKLLNEILARGSSK